MIELLASNYPPLKTSYSTFPNAFFDGLSEADKALIATGYISVDSITELTRIIELNRKPFVDLIIGMHFFEGFTRPQFQAVKKLVEVLGENNLGNVYLATVSKYHGKVYAFTDSKENPFSSIIGSSNLSSIMTVERLYESDIQIKEDAFNRELYTFLTSLKDQYSRPFSSIKEIKINDMNTLLEDHYRVERVTETLLNEVKDRTTDISFQIPLSATPRHTKSNLNAYFGKGRENKKTGLIKPRHWYEVEVIVPKEITSQEEYPQRESVIHVYTDDGWKFNCKISGDYSKNFRSEDDLTILGKWIKGRLENYGVLTVGELVTEETLERYGRKHFNLTKTYIPDTWYLDFGV